MRDSWREIDPSIKAKVALEAAKGERSIGELAREYGVSPDQVRVWRKCFLEVLPGLFSEERTDLVRTDEQLISSLCRQIGMLKIELDGLKRKTGRYDH